MLIDTHAHIFLEPFESDLDQVIERANGAGITDIFMPAIDIASIYRALDLAAQYDGLHVMAGLHPSEIKDATDEQFEEVRKIASDDRIVAIGETGLDYYWDQSFNEKQHQFLRKHIQLAAEVDKPLVFHDREASWDLIRIVREEQEAADDASKIRGIFHCFGGPVDVTEAVLELGFHMGIGGTLTFKNGGIPDAISTVPLERIVLETDSPFLTPAPFRGKRNEPAYVRLVAEKLAEIRGISLEEVAEITTLNARRIFGQPRPSAPSQ